VKTYIAKPQQIKREWFLVDATNKPLGRLASQVAHILMGKHKPYYTPHLDVGDYVVVVNCDKVKLTGKKLEKKIYYRHSGYPGGLKQIPYEKLLQEKPERVLELAIKRMLPNNRLGRAMFKKLKVYKGPEHPHKAQQVKPLSLKGV
jgi:large subunit ribosomal protein L13